jgi:hypothetical protein
MMPSLPAVAAIVPLRWVRARQARVYLGNVSPRTFKRWKDKGVVKGFQFGDTELFDLKALDRQVMKGGV